MNVHALIITGCAIRNEAHACVGVGGAGANDLPGGVAGRAAALSSRRPILGPVALIPLRGPVHRHIRTPAPLQPRWHIQTVGMGLTAFAVVQGTPHNISGEIQAGIEGGARGQVPRDVGPPIR